MEEIDHVLIRYWNDRVNFDDDVYIIGDLCCRSEKPPEWYLNQLKERKHLVVGNHDKVILKREKTLSKLEEV